MNDDKRREYLQALEAFNTAAQRLADLACQDTDLWNEVLANDGYPERWLCFLEEAYEIGDWYWQASAHWNPSYLSDNLTKQHVTLCHTIKVGRK